MSLKRSGYRKFGIEPIEPLKYWSHRVQKKPMGEKNKDDGIGDPIKMLLEETLVRKRNEMMDKVT
jgi:hypothetical protein